MYSSSFFICKEMIYYEAKPDAKECFDCEPKSAQIDPWMTKENAHKILY